MSDDLDNTCPGCGYDPSILPEREWTITLSMVAPSGNQLGANDRGPRGYKYRAWKGKFQRALKLRLGDVAKARPDKKRRLWICRQYGKSKRPYDVDNLHWGCKPLVDLLVKAGVIYDDNPKFVERYISQERSPDGQNYIVIRIEELPCD